MLPPCLRLGVARKLLPLKLFLQLEPLPARYGHCCAGVSVGCIDNNALRCHARGATGLCTLNSSVLQAADCELGDGRALPYAVLCYAAAHAAAHPARRRMQCACCKSVCGTV